MRGDGEIEERGGERDRHDKTPELRFEPGQLGPEASMLTTVLCCPPSGAYFESLSCNDNFPKLLAPELYEDKRAS